MRRPAFACIVALVTVATLAGQQRPATPSTPTQTPTQTPT